MKHILKINLIILALIFTACEIEELGNPNNPTLEDFERTTSLDDLLLLVTGTEADMRTDIALYLDEVSIIAREYYDLNGTDPRFTGELLAGSLDPGGFLTTRSYAARYGVIRNAQTLLNALENTSATLSDQEKNGFSGFCNTIIAYQLLLNLNMQFENGIRVDVVDADNLGPFVGYTEALQAISTRMDEASTQLANAGDEFIFSLTSGFSGFDTPATFRQFNRGLAARIALYQGDKTKALTALADSFFDIDGDLALGAYHTYNAGDGILNPVFRIEADKFMAHPSYVTDAETGDTRLSKVRTIGSVTTDNLTSDLLVSIYANSDDNLPIVRNEELILLYAEAQVGNNNTEAIAAINRIRGEAGLADYAGATDDNALIDEILHQKRYSLFGEGYRWVDLRRYNKFDEIPLDRAGDLVQMQFPRPLAETNASN